MKIKIITLCFIYVNISCHEYPMESATEWSNTIKQKIIEDSGTAPNSTQIDSSEGEYWKHLLFHDNIKTKEFRINSLSNDTTLSIFYSRDQSFDLVRERCPGGESSFEVIRYKKLHFGLTEFHYCNGQLKEQGFRYNDKDVGIWKEWNDNGELINEVDHGNAKILKKLNEIKYYR